MSPPARRRGPGQGPSSDSTATTPRLVDPNGTPRLGSWTTTTRLRLVAGPDGSLCSTDLLSLQVALPVERGVVELRHAEHSSCPAAAAVGRALARAAAVDVVGDRPRVAAAFRDVAQDVPRRLLEVGGGA